MDLIKALGITAELPATAGQFRGALLILGGGHCLYDDLLKLGAGSGPGTFWADLAAKWPGEIMAVNDIGLYAELRIAHWCSLHDNFLPHWRALRSCRGFDNLGHVHTHGIRHGAAVECVWTLPTIGGSSGLFGAYVGLLLGYDRIVLAGMPMDNSGHFFDPPGTAGGSFFGRPDMIEWEWARDNAFGGRVRSLSGKTREILGAPL